LAEPLRWRIVELLGGEELGVAQLWWATPPGRCAKRGWSRPRVPVIGPTALSMGAGSV